MHPNLTFRAEVTERNIAFARDRPFGVLAVSTPRFQFEVQHPALIPVRV